MGGKGWRGFTYISDGDFKEIVCSSSTFIESRSKSTCAYDKNDKSMTLEITAEGVNQKGLSMARPSFDEDG